MEKTKTERIGSLIETAENLGFLWAVDRLLVRLNQTEAGGSSVLLVEDVISDLEQDLAGRSKGGRSRTSMELSRLLAIPSANETAQDWQELFGGDLGICLLRAARHARVDGGLSRETCRRAMLAIRDARKDPDSYPARGYPRWCVEHGKYDASYVLRPGACEEISGQYQDPGMKESRHESSIDQHLRALRGERG